MTTSFFILEQMDAVYKVEQDWLFEKLPGKLNSHRHLILAAEKHPDIHICYLDMKPLHSSFLSKTPGMACCDKDTLYLYDNHLTISFTRS